jgi:hypothetical protein
MSNMIRDRHDETSHSATHQHLSCGIFNDVGSVESAGNCRVPVGLHESLRQDSWDLHHHMDGLEMVMAAYMEEVESAQDK